MCPDPVSSSKSFISQAYHDTLIFEAAVNYTKADEITTVPADKPEPHSPNAEYIYSDEEFWKKLFNNPEQSWDKDFRTGYQVTLSEWVARVPGMYWHGESRQFHKVAEESIFRSLPGGLKVYPPQTKSSFVMGGTGTIKLPHDSSGRRLASISTNKNASVGIPVLIYPEVWDYYKLKEGDTINGVFKWKKMESQWAQHFLSSKNIVRGYLELQHPDQIKKGHEDGYNMYHPFSIMEYEKKGMRYYDFVFLTMSASIDRAVMKEFLKTYAKENGNGKYLLESDINNPLFDGQFSDPAQFRSNGQEHLEFMERRMNDTLSGSDLQEQVLSAITTNYNSDDLRRLSTSIDIGPSLWDIGGSMADVAVSFLNEVNQKVCLHQLIEAIERDFPDLIDD